MPPGHRPYRARSSVRYAPGRSWPDRRWDDLRLVGLKLIFLIVSRAVSLLGLSRREAWWKDAEILMLRHQLAVTGRERPGARARLTWANPTLPLPAPHTTAAVGTTAGVPSSPPGGYPLLKGATSGFVLENNPAGFGYQTQTCIVTRSGCQKVNAAPVFGAFGGQVFGFLCGMKVPSL